MFKLIDYNKDRRWKITAEDVQNVFVLDKAGVLMKDIATVLGVSHQRISQILDRNRTMKEVRKVQARKNMAKYRRDKRYRAKMLSDKRLYYKYKVKVWARLVNKN